MDQKMMKACFEPHIIVHSVTGLGIGFLIVGLTGLSGNTALMIGAIALIGGVLADFAVNPAKKK